MLEDEEYKREKHQPFEADTDLQYFAEILDEFVLNLDDLEESHHARHPDHLIEFAYSCESRDSIEAPTYQHKIEGKHRYHIDCEPRCQIFLSNDLYM